MILFYKRGFNFSTTSSRITSFFRLIKIEGAANDDYNVLIALMDYFGCGEVKKYTNKDACVYRIHSYKNLLEKKTKFNRANKNLRFL